MQRKVILLVVFLLSLGMVLGLFGMLSATASALDGPTDVSLASMHKSMPFLQVIQASDIPAPEVTAPKEKEWTPDAQGNPLEPDFLQVGELGQPDNDEYMERRLRAQTASLRYSTRQDMDGSSPYHNRRMPPEKSALRTVYEATTESIQPASSSNTPAQLTASNSITLSTVHRNTSESGQSSTFIFTNTGVASTNFSVDFYWPNGEYLSTDGPWSLSPRCKTQT
jgi:hypothetical protein